MKKTNSSNDLWRYTLQMYLGMFSGLLVLASIGACFGLAGNLFDLACFLTFSLVSSSICMFAGENC